MFFKKTLVAIATVSFTLSYAAPTAPISKALSNERLNIFERALLHERATSGREVDQCGWQFDSASEWRHVPIPADKVTSVINKACQKLSEYTFEGVKECQEGPARGNYQKCFVPLWEAARPPSGSSAARDRYAATRRVVMLSWPEGTSKRAGGTWLKAAFMVHTPFLPKGKKYVVSKQECVERFQYMQNTCSKGSGKNRMVYSADLLHNPSKQIYTWFNLNTERTTYPATEISGFQPGEVALA